MTSSDSQPATNQPIAIISAPGSRGDVNPMVAIGCELKRHGFRVIISLAENYASVAQRAGLEPHALITKDQFDLLTSDPRVWTPIHGIRAILRDAACAFLEPHFKLIQQHHQPGRTVLISHPLDLASRIFRDIDPSTPLASVHLAPAMVRDFENPPRLTSWQTKRPPPAMLTKAAYFLADHWVGDRWLAEPINQLRRRFGLEDVSRVLEQWWLSPDLVLALYPDWFANVRPAVQGRWVSCGFPIPLDDREHDGGFGSAEAPVFVTPGTAHRHAQRLLSDVMIACEMIERRCIVATSFAEQLPASLPSHVTAMGYVSLNQTLRECSAIVHHGGIGTTAMSMFTGCPQLICPMAFDQFHNADRVKSLGIGDTYEPRTWTSHKQKLKQLAGLLASLTSNAQTRTACQQLAARVGSFRGAENASNEIVDLLRFHA